jgi:hypothetical protein
MWVYLASISFSIQCDCSIGEYCSRDVWNRRAGKCQSFKAEGKTCVRMTSTELADSTISSKYKCADIVEKGGQVVLVDKTGICLDSVCRACNPYTKDSITCSDGGLGSPRVCAHPGTFIFLFILYEFVTSFYQEYLVMFLGIWVSPNHLLWRNIEYGEEPTYVWLAIYFPFMLCGLLCLCVICMKETGKVTLHLKRAHYERIGPVNQS